MHQTGKKQVYDCRMRAIDSNGFDMEYADAKGGPTQSTRLAFVRPRLADALSTPTKCRTRR
jgi:hypothetical protein